MILRLLCLFLLIVVAGCSQTTLLTKQDYQASQRAFVQGNADNAFLEFPRGAEQGTFITTVEKTYLNLIQGKAQIKDLQHQADLLDKRVRYHVSREAKTFFYLQTPEDYYASEHEIIWLHLLLSWGYSLQGQYESGCVEARQASSLLTLPWSPNGHFDDPTLRLFLAGLWTMCGEWREAQVDLRAAWFMDNRLVWAKELAERDKAPAHLFIVLGGPGPELQWNPELTSNPLRSERQVLFKLRGKKSRIFLLDRNGIAIEPQLSPDASSWYERHLARESELHELILDSAYGGQAAVSGTIASARIAATTSAGLAIGIGGAVLGGAIVYAGLNSSNSSNGNVVELGLIIAAASIAEGMKISREGYRESSREFKRDLDTSIHYRFVRYLPEYLWMGWSDQNISYPVEVRSPSTSVVLKLPSVSGQTSVSIAHLPDMSSARIFLRTPAY